MKFSKDLIKTIVIVILILLLIGIFVIPKYNQVIYNRGFDAGQLNVAKMQGKSASLFLAVNETIKVYSLKDVCGSIGQNG